MIHQQFNNVLLWTSSLRSYGSASIIPDSSYRPNIQRRDASAVRGQATQVISSAEASPGPPPPRIGTFDRDNDAGQTINKGKDGLKKPASDSDEDASRKVRRELDKELLYLQDPLKLAENTVRLLRNNDDEKALELVRMASKRASCIVSWNHVIDYELSKSRVSKALKTYNEMKKRAQQPDAHTYTILLRGLAWNPDPEQSLPHALKIYYSMFADNCPVKPNVIHTNAILKVCALAKDLDAMWGVAAKLPTRGPGASNNLTFTIILNAIRQVAWQNDKVLTDEAWEQKSLRRQRAIMQGRKLWEEIIPRWRAGDVWIDEELVCAMGRLLLVGSARRDYDDVLSLVEQVMAVPRQMPSLPEPKGPGSAAPAEDQIAIASQPVQTEEPSISDEVEDEIHPSENNVEGSVPQLDHSETEGGPLLTLEPALTHVFRSESQQIPKAVSVARPGRNTLSLLLSACTTLRAISAAQSYWGILTDPSGPYNIQPDAENYHGYLRLLRVQRASKLAADLVQDMHSGELKEMNMLRPKTFRIALSSCTRNKLNPNAIVHAGRVVDIMCKRLKPLDVRALDMYVDTISAVAAYDFRAAVAAIRTSLATAIRLLKNWVNFSAQEVGERARDEIMELVQKVYGVCDRTMDLAGDRLEARDRRDLAAMRSSFRVWLKKLKGKEEEEEEEV
ncbi:MAG: hypothetical protein Q9219_005211 [cf. Caloplaca sp. 3 TL-2023]